MRPRAWPAFAEGVGGAMGAARLNSSVLNFTATIVWTPRSSRGESRIYGFNLKHTASPRLDRGVHLAAETRPPPTQFLRANCKSIPFIYRYITISYGRF